jgi:hypothetical protein
MIRKSFLLGIIVSMTVLTAGACASNAFGQTNRPSSPSKKHHGWQPYHGWSRHHDWSRHHNWSWYHDHYAYPFGLLPYGFDHEHHAYPFGHMPYGLEVSQVTPWSPAAQAGIERGDIIIAVNGWPAGTIGEMNRLLARNVGAARLAVIDGKTGLVNQVAVLPLGGGIGVNARTVPIDESTELLR